MDIVLTIFIIMKNFNLNFYANKLITYDANHAINSDLSILNTTLLRLPTALRPNT